MDTLRRMSQVEYILQYEFFDIVAVCDLTLILLVTVTHDSACIDFCPFTGYVMLIGSITVVGVSFVSSLSSYNYCNSKNIGMSSFQ